MDERGCENLVIAIIQQAVQDWRYLANGGTETKDCNFKELTRFFESDCNGLLVNTSKSGKDILESLQREKRSSRCATKAKVYPQEPKR